MGINTRQQHLQFHHETGGKFSYSVPLIIMILPSQLRLGNFVQDERDKVYKVLAIHEDLLVLEKTGAITHIPFKKIYPIDFGEWFGRPYAVTRYFELEKVKTLSVDSRGRVALSDNFLMYRVTLEGVCVEWVHQLQNLYFALTGKEISFEGHHRGRL
jgi:hypothetical protein